MIAESAKIIKVDGHSVWIETESRSACSQCSNSGCNTSVLAKLFNIKPNQFQLNNDCQAEPGEQVKVVISDSLLVKAALLIYLLPLLTMLTLTIIAQQMGANEGTQAILALIGLGLGFSSLNYIKPRLERQFKPSLIRCNVQE